MLENGDRLTELTIEQERLEEERDGEDCGELRLLEIEKDLDDIIVEAESITATLDTLEEHLTFVNEKIERIEKEVNSFDIEEI